MWDCSSGYEDVLCDQGKVCIKQYVANKLLNLPWNVDEWKFWNFDNFVNIASGSWKGKPRYISDCKLRFVKTDMHINSLKSFPPKTDMPRMCTAERKVFWRLL